MSEIMSTKNHREKHFIIALLTIIAAIVIVILILNYKKSDLEKVEDRVGLDLSTNMVVESCDLFNEYGESHASVELLIQKDYEILQEEIEEKYGENLISTAEVYLRSPVLSEFVKDKNVLAYYNRAISGKKAKTINIDLFIAQSEDGKLYLYIFY